MNQKIKQIIQNSFYQLLAIYTVLIVLISLNLFGKFSLQVSIFALLVAVFGIFTIKNEDPEKLDFPKGIHYSLFVLAILIILISRLIPYIGNNIPLGYDTGIYKYGIEHGLTNLDFWIRSGMEPGFLYLMKLFSFIFSTEFMLTYLLIGFCLLLGISVYLFTKEYFGKKAAIISLLVYSVSVIQFQTFWYMYYKNIIGLALMLFSLFFLKKAQNSPKHWYRTAFIASAGLLGAIHRPTFYIFGLSYLFYSVFDSIKSKKLDFKTLKYHIINGFFILLIFISFYIGKFWSSLFVLSDVAQGFISPGASSGTFINFFTYQYSTLAYLPFAILGLFYLIKKKNFNILFFWAVINATIVYFQFFFFNRFIIMLDIPLIILASIGFCTIIENKKKFGTIILIIMLLSAGFVLINQSITSKPLINQNELSVIKYLNNTENNSFVMATSSYYSPWLQGYSGRRVIAPGLFDYNTGNKSEWMNFWTTKNMTEVKNFLDPYGKPLYIFIGEKQEKNIVQFNSSGCFEIFFKQSDNTIYKYTC